jgi:hypothetical protein
LEGETQKEIELLKTNLKRRKGGEGVNSKTIKKTTGPMKVGAFTDKALHVTHYM